MHHPTPSTWLRTGFAAEAQWLNAIAATNTLRVPRPVAHGISNSHSFLILEYLELGSRGDAKLLGGGYTRQAEQMMQKLLATCRMG